LQEAIEELDRLMRQQPRRISKVHGENLPPKLFHVTPERGVPDKQFID